MPIKNEVWILADDRPGTFSQSIGLAEEMGVKYKVITLSYSLFSYLPNFLLGTSMLRISKEFRKRFREIEYLPSVVISAGRRSAPIALNLKSQSNNQTKVIQIMNPNLDFAKFDFVVLPKHDQFEEKNYPNLITTIGALTRIDAKRLVSEGEKFPELKEITKTKIALLVGGNGKKTIFTKNDGAALAKTASEVTKNMGATLLILTSRRTGEDLKNALLENLNCDYQLFDWDKINTANPYLAIVGVADYFIVTGDSVSMISECASTSKPLYIFDQENISGEKHRRFHQNLFAENYAKKFGADLKTLENFAPKKLQETKRVAQYVKDKIT